MGIWNTGTPVLEKHKKREFFSPHPIRSLFLRYKFFFLYVSLIHLFIRLKLFLKCFKLFSWQVVFCCLFFLSFLLLSLSIQTHTHTRAKCDGGDFLSLTRGSTNGTKEERKGIKIKTVQSMVELIVSSSRGSIFFFNFFFCLFSFPSSRKWEKENREEESV